MPDTTPDTATDQASAELRAAWDELIARLQTARDAIESPELHAPPANPRRLAEGYRYLAGFLYSAVERSFFADPRFPYFRRAIQIIDKSTIDNADAIYLDARIDGECTYRITGRADDHRHWQGKPAAESGPIAPRYVIVEGHGGFAGDTGELAELMNGERFLTDSIDSAELEVDADGRFEILVGPERPEGHTGNFLRTKGDDGRAARHVILRELFHDWERERPLDLAITRIGGDAEHPDDLDVLRSAAALARTGLLVENQMKFWNEFYDVLLETHGDRNGDGQTFMPRNALNAPLASTMGIGGGQSTNVYAGGIFELDPDEALVIEVEVPHPPAYAGFHVANLWGESLDYAHRITSLNQFQAHHDDDGRTRYVVAHTDPGVPNWLDTTGLREGFMTFRWAYSGSAPEEMPVVTTAKVAAADIREHLPASTPTVTADQRTEQIKVRRDHVQLRYRQH